MKRFYFLLFFITYVLIKGQNPCIPSQIPNQVFYPGSTSVGTSSPSLYQYLCGTRTVVYDTITNNTWNFWAYATAGTTLYINNGGLSAHFIYLKSGATLNIMQNAGIVILYLESGAVVNNPFAIFTQTTLCNNITFPIVDCSVGLNEVSKSENEIKIYPNPTTSKLFIEQRDLNKITITNYLGRLVFTLNDLTPKQEIDLTFLSSGIYYLKTESKESQRVFKVLKE